MATIGLLGGSFNPAHGGHRRISLQALRALGLDEVWWLVSPGNPLKEPKGMASFESRYRSALATARIARIRVSGIERQMGTRYTVDTLRALQRRFPQHRFIWLMGADNLAQFHRWREWREIARLVPIAVVTRPGYDADAHMARSMGWLRRFVRPVAHANAWTKWRTPALVLLKSPPDPTSATALRAVDPDWHQKTRKSFNPRALRDRVTRRPL